MVISALIFLFVALVMSWPMMASGRGFFDALFESISGVTTTGLTTTSTVVDKPGSFLFARSWMQWVGGLGIVVLSLAVMIQPGLMAKRLGDGLRKRSERRHPSACPPRFHCVRRSDGCRYHLPKAVPCANMLLGRLEILAWLILLFPGTWVGERLEE